MGRKTTRKEFTCLYTIAGEEGPYRRLTVKASSVADAMERTESLIRKDRTTVIVPVLEQFMAFETRTTKTKGQ